MDGIADSVDRIEEGTDLAVGNTYFLDRTESDRSRKNFESQSRCAPVSGKNGLTPHIGRSLRGLKHSCLFHILAEE